MPDISRIFQHSCAVLVLALTGCASADEGAAGAESVGQESAPVSGGGCGARVTYQWGQYNSIRITACISYANSRLRPDVYVEGAAPPGRRCEIREVLYIGGVATPDSHVYDCNPQHYGPWPYSVNPPYSGTAYTRAAVVLDGGYEAAVSFSNAQHWP